MNNLTSQRGSAHVIIIVIVSLLVLGAVGYVFWNNFIRSKDEVVSQATSTTTTDTPTVDTKNELAYKTFTTDRYNVSFEHPETWGVAQTTSDDSYAYVRSYDVKVSEDAQLSLSTGGQVGGTCEESDRLTYDVVSAKAVDVKANQPVYISYVVYPNADGTYSGTYGLTSFYTEIKSSTGCPNTFYLFISSVNANLKIMAFGGTNMFATVGAAKDFVKTDTFKVIEKVLGSLKYDS